MRQGGRSATLAHIYQPFVTLRARTATLLVAGGLALAACAGGADEADPRVLGVTVTTTAPAPAPASPASPAPPGDEGATATTAAPVSTTTTAAAGPTASGTGTVDVRYRALRPDATVTVDLEREDGSIADSADASGGGGATFTAAAGRYRVSITEIGRPEQSGDTATSSAVTSRTELFELAPGDTVVVECAGNADCTVIAA